MSSFRDQDLEGTHRLWGRGTPHQFGGISIETNDKKIPSASTTMCLSPSSPSLVSEIDLFAPSGSVFCCDSLSCLPWRKTQKKTLILNDNFHRNKLEIVPWLSIRNRRSSVTNNNNNNNNSKRRALGQCYAS